MASILVWPLLGAPASSRHLERTVAMPAVVLWAWQRPEDLRWIDKEKVGVAYLAKTLNLSASGVTIVEPRLQPLMVPNGTKMIAVVRVQAESPSTPLADSQREKAVTEILELAQKKSVLAVQIDFDASKSQRSFYQKLLTELSARLPDSKALSVTALASWCMFDPWIDSMPVDEVVPMVFRMGAETKKILMRFSSGQKSLCDGKAIGLSIDELDKPRVSAAHEFKRIYLFSPHRWTQKKLNAALTALKHVF